MALYNAKSEVFCLNDQCAEEIFLLADVGRHFIDCGYKKTCSICGFVGKVLFEIEEHVCLIQVTDVQVFNPPTNIIITFEFTSYLY